MHESQILVAKQLLDAMEKSSFAGKGEKLCQRGFNDFAFYIQLPRMNSLYQQTVDRLAPFMKHYAENLPDFFPGMIEAATAAAAADQRANKNSWLDPYLIKASADSKDTQGRIEVLMERIRMEPKTLFLIIQDEAHYEMVKGKAADLFTNSDYIRLGENVLTLYVSATPYSIFTKESQVPIQNEIRMDTAIESGTKVYYGMAKYCVNSGQWGPGKMTNDSDFENHVERMPGSKGKQRMYVRGDVLAAEYVCAMKNARQAEQDDTADPLHGLDEVSPRTNAMVTDLLKPRADGKGVMILIRADCIANAERLCNDLKDARAKCGLEDRFALILDVLEKKTRTRKKTELMKEQIPGPLQRRMVAWRGCEGVEDLQVKTYEDLEGLPCILVLVQKGKMGDSFPKSLRYCEFRTTAFASALILVKTSLR